MRTILLACLLIFAAPAAFSQDTAAVPFKGANVLYITLPDSGAVAWKQLAAALSAGGLSVKASDGQLLTVATDYRKLDANLAVALSGRVSGRTVALRGVLSNELLEQRDLPIFFLGKKSGTYARAWAELAAVAGRLPGTVRYGRD